MRIRRDETKDAKKLFKIKTKYNFYRKDAKMNTKEILVKSSFSKDFFGVKY